MSEPVVVPEASAETPEVSDSHRVKGELSIYRVSTPTSIPIWQCSNCHRDVIEDGNRWQVNMWPENNQTFLTFSLCDSCARRFIQRSEAERR